MARYMTDYMRDGNMDLLIVDGDFVRGEATAAHQKDIVLDAPGEYVDNPLVGVGVNNYIDDDHTNLARDINMQFMMDGMEVVNNKVNVAAFGDDTLRLFPGSFYK